MRMLRDAQGLKWLNFLSLKRKSGYLTIKIDITVKQGEGVMPKPADSKRLTHDSA